MAWRWRHRREDSPRERETSPRDTGAPLGRRGEDATREFFLNAGYRVLCRNWLAPHHRGELDLVCQDEAGTLCFVEVKTRRILARSAGAGERPVPLEAVTPAKERRLRRAAADYLRALGRPRVPFRFDVVEVWADAHGRPCQLRHWPDLLPGRPSRLLEEEAGES
ncbi:MAG: YraN family protein [Oligosphaeraceae bacterium]